MVEIFGLSGPPFSKSDINSFKANYLIDIELIVGKMAANFFGNRIINFVLAKKGDQKGGI